MNISTSSAQWHSSASYLQENSIRLYQWNYILYSILCLFDVLRMTCNCKFENCRSQSTLENTQLIDGSTVHWWFESAFTSPMVFFYNVFIHIAVCLLELNIMQTNRAHSRFTIYVQKLNLSFINKLDC